MNYQVAITRQFRLQRPAIELAATAITRRPQRVPAALLAVSAAVGSPAPSLQPTLTPYTQQVRFHSDLLIKQQTINNKLKYANYFELHPRGITPTKFKICLTTVGALNLQCLAWLPCTQFNQFRVKDTFWTSKEEKKRVSQESIK